LFELPLVGNRVILLIGSRDHIWRASPRSNRYARNTIDGGTVLSQDFREFVASLNASDVRYLVVGGYAVALHGHPRYTKDIDIWIDSTPDNAERVVRALDAFGFGSVKLTEGDFLVPNQIIQLGYPPNRIDLLTSLSGVNFAACYPARVEVDIDGVAVPFIDLENLRKNKQAAGRTQDLADLENLE
jgi:predicted nucleotidyltransferase